MCDGGMARYLLYVLFLPVSEDQAYESIPDSCSGTLSRKPESDAPSRIGCRANEQHDTHSCRSIFQRHAKKQRRIRSGRKEIDDSSDDPWNTEIDTCGYD